MFKSQDRSVLITGGTAGLGYHCAIAIARQHPEYQVVIASRSDPNDAATSINRLLNQKNVRYLRLDLSSLTEVRSFAKRWEGKNYPPIQALLLNAGLQFPREVQYTVDGFESTFGINHVGHALLFSLLQSHLSDTARIVVTSSGTHDPAQKTGMPDAKYTTASELAHPTPESAKNNAGRQRYSTSKLVNVLWMYALHRRRQKSWTVVAFDPGLMPGTGLAREANAVVRFLWSNVLPHLLPLLRILSGNSNIHPPEKSGSTLAWLAVSPDVASTSGVYYEERKQIKTSEASYDEEKQEDLWEWTAKNTGTSNEEMELFSLGGLNSNPESK